MIHTCLQYIVSWVHCIIIILVKHTVCIPYIPVCLLHLPVPVPTVGRDQHEVIVWNIIKELGVHSIHSIVQASQRMSEKQVYSKSIWKNRTLKLLWWIQSLFPYLSCLLLWLKEKVWLEDIRCCYQIYIIWSRVFLSLKLVKT